VIARALAFAGVVAGLAGVARADGGVAIETYTGQRHASAQALIAPVLDELAARGFTAGYAAVGTKYERDVSRPGKATGVPATFAADVDAGHQAWMRGKHAQAIAALAPLIDIARANAADVAQDQAIRAATQRALLALALAHHAAGDAAATRETLGDLVRSFPDFAVSRATHGPDAFELYQATKKQLDGQARGTLDVQVANPSTAVFVNETFVRLGSVQKTDMVPGVYRVYVALPPSVGRVYRVEIAPGETTRLAIDERFDGALHVASDWTGLAFTDAAERDEHEATYAARFGTLLGATQVAVVGIDDIGEHNLAVIGALVDPATGREVRRASLLVEPPPGPDKLRALARFLAGDDDAGAELQVELGPMVDRSKSHVHRPSPSLRWGWRKYALAAGGVAIGAVGAYLIAVDGECAEPPPTPMSPCPSFKNTAVAGYITAGAGLAALGVAVYMFVTEGPRDRATVSIIPTADGAFASALVTF
jgi:hypothetical protein